MNLTALKKEFQEDLKSLGFEVSKKDVDDITDAFINILYKNIVAGKKIYLGRIGHFYSKMRIYTKKAGFGPKNDKVNTYKRFVIKMKPSRTMKQDINRPFIIEENKIRQGGKKR